MDVATVKGVVERLKDKGFVELKPDLEDKRRLVIFLSEKGENIVQGLVGDLATVAHHDPDGRPADKDADCGSRNQQDEWLKRLPSDGETRQEDQQKHQCDARGHSIDQASCVFGSTHLQT